MSELRKDPLSRRGVIIATERQARPQDFSVQHSAPQRRTCPFCPGNEHLTPPEIMAYRSNGFGGSWSVRVVPNRFPALRSEGELKRDQIGLYEVMTGVGVHEVIIESPVHEQTLSTMPVSALSEVLWCYRERLAQLKRDKRFGYILIFKNHGESAGASLEHPHSQLIALPEVPQSLAVEFQRARAFHDSRGCCIFCGIFLQESEARERVIAGNTNFLVIAPFASRFPFEICILPARHCFAFEEATAREMEDLAQIFSETLRSLDKVIGLPAYNLILHTGPLGGDFADASRYYHWHLEILPVLTKVAGFEWGTGCFINPVPPEEAARVLREGWVSASKKDQGMAGQTPSLLGEASTAV